MRSVPKTSETLAAIIALHQAGKSHAQIGDHLNLAKSTVTTIINRHNRQPTQPLRPTKRAGRPLKLDERSKRALIRYVERRPHDNLKALETPSKSGTTYLDQHYDGV